MACTASPLGRISATAGVQNRRTSQPHSDLRSTLSTSGAVEAGRLVCAVQSNVLEPAHLGEGGGGSEWVGEEARWGRKDADSKT